ncbi:hypothetical protein [Denitromonas sp.]|uniref:hypothetical protein n=1 Tax=Denitromonas sp. TaxID=2734609 RepID=UPI002AFDE0AD|nr:hypothetical protein [Denitromonas sp.]
MSAAEDRFIAGAGPLAALIRAQPAFEAPPRMLEHILAALDAAPSATGFDAPAGLFDAVMAEAERIDSAQAPRRDALLAELAAGKTADDALGASVSPATAAWLAGQQQPTNATPPPRRRRWPWLAGLSTALTAALAVSVALRVVQEPAAPPVPMSAPAESRADLSSESIAGNANDAITLAPKPQRAERKVEAAPPQIARARQSEPVAGEVKRIAPRPAAAAAKMADAAPAESTLAPPPPAAAPPMMAKALRVPAPGSPPAAEADAATTDIIDAPLDTPAATLAARLLARPAQAWTLHVAPADAAAGRAVQAALLAQLQAAGREDPIALAERPLPRGRLRLLPTP